MARRPSEDARIEAIRRLLSGLANGADAHELVAAVADLHPKNNTFPGEVFMELAADAFDVAGVSRDGPIPYEGLLEVHLPECRFRGRENRKIQYAILISAARRAGLEPDLLDEIIWWRTDDYWRYALFAAVAIIRACSARSDNTVPEFVERLAQIHSLELS